jgi:hypothetical protein
MQANSKFIPELLSIVTETASLEAMGEESSMQLICLHP